jgi:hypothetical protein
LREFPPNPMIPIDRGGRGVGYLTINDGRVP